jgi:DNA-binding GntR family transcriptional regulator
MPRLKNNSKDTKDYAERAYIGIKQMLFHHEIAPGHKILYRDLAERLGMSITPITIALKWLEVQDLVRHETNRGYYTGTVSLEQVQEIFDLRQLLEVSLLPETIRRLEKNGLQRLKASIQAHLDTIQSNFVNEWLYTDMNFHLTLASLSHRETHQRMLNMLFDLFYIKYSGTMFFGSSVRPIASDHEIIFDFVASRNIVRAQEALAQHISIAKERITKNLKQAMEFRNGKRTKRR